MRLQSGGMDVFYIDESMHDDLYAFTAISIPFLRQVENVWTIVWPDQFERLREWRRGLGKDFQVRMRKDLHANKFLPGRGQYRYGNRQFSKAETATIYRAMLERLDHFLPDASIINGVCTARHELHGLTGPDALLFEVFQRMRTASARSNRNGIVFFDQGHPEYIHLYRRSQVFMPTGSAYGTWEGGKTVKNLPMSMFTKDGNIKQSEMSWYVQVADLVAYALMLKIRERHNKLTWWQKKYGLADVFDSIPERVLNTRASAGHPKGIVWCD